MHRLPESTIKLISSTQVISSVYSAVKELVENAIDAGATSLDIKLEAHGLSRIEVFDNGSGVSKEHADMMAKNHCTSKIRCQGDLYALSTFGFRGEALYALCSVAEVSVLSRTASDEAGSVYTFDSHGNLVSTKPTPREVGTTVVVKNLFKGLPVRKQLYQTKRKCREELNRIEEMLVEFALVYPRLRIVLKHDKHIIWQKAGTGSLRETLVILFGSMVTDNLHDINIVSEEIGDGCLTKLSGLIRLSALSGQRAVPDMKVYVNVNQRPVLLKSVLKHLKNYMKTMEIWAIALVVLSIFVSPKFVDANIEPNKGTVMIENMDEILSLLSKALDHILMANNLNPVTSAKTDVGTKKSAYSEKENKQDERVQQVRGFLKKTTSLQSSDLEPVQNEEILILSKTMKPETSHHLLVNRSGVKNIESKRVLGEGSIVATDEQNGDVNQISSIPKHIGSSFASHASKGNPLDEHVEFVTIHHKENGGFDHDIGRANEDRGVPQLFGSQAESVCMVGSDELHNSRSSQEQIQERSLEKTPRIGVDDLLFIDDEMSSDLDIEQDVESNGEGKSEQKTDSGINSLDTPSLSQVTLDDWSRGIAVKDSNGEALKPAFLHVPSVHNGRNVSSKSRGSKEKSKKPKGKFETCQMSSPPKKRISRLPCKTVDFSIQNIQNVGTLRYRRTQLPTEFKGTKVVGKLQECNVWVVMRDKQIMLFSPFRAQECLVYRNLVKSHKLPMSKMDRPIALSEGLLGKEEYGLLRRLDVEYRPSELGKYLDEQRITWNGFDVKVRTGQDCSSYGMDVVRMNQTIPFYGIKDLSEILQAMLTADEYPPLESARPLKVVNHLKSEAARIARSSGSLTSTCEIQEMVDQILLESDLGEAGKCFHGKAIFNELRTQNL